MLGCTYLFSESTGTPNEGGSSPLLAMSFTMLLSRANAGPEVWQGGN